MDTPNDMELGMKVRQAYHDAIGIKPSVKWESIGRG
jgi:hypothetical protein